MLIADQAGAGGMLRLKAWPPRAAGGDRHHLRELMATLSGLQAREMSMPHVAIRRARNG